MKRDTRTWSGIRGRGAGCTSVEWDTQAWSGIHGLGARYTGVEYLRSFVKFQVAKRMSAYAQVHLYSRSSIACCRLGIFKSTVLKCPHTRSNERPPVGRSRGRKIAWRAQRASASEAEVRNPAVFAGYKFYKQGLLDLNRLCSICESNEIEDESHSAFLRIALNTIFLEFYRKIENISVSVF